MGQYMSPPWLGHLYGDRFCSMGQYMSPPGSDTSTAAGSAPWVST